MLWAYMYIEILQKSIAINVGRDKLSLKLNHVGLASYLWRRMVQVAPVVLETLDFQIVR